MGQLKIISKKENKRLELGKHIDYPWSGCACLFEAVELSVSTSDWRDFGFSMRTAIPAAIASCFARTRCKSSFRASPWQRSSSSLELVRKGIRILCQVLTRVRARLYTCMHESCRYKVTLVWLDRTQKVRYNYSIKILGSIAAHKAAIKRMRACVCARIQVCTNLADMRWH